VAKKIKKIKEEVAIVVPEFKSNKELKQKAKDAKARAKGKS